VKRDFSRYLIKNDVVAGFGLCNENGEIDVLLHPDDETTGVSYRLLPMNRGILSGLFNRDQAAAHLEVIEEHLKGPDGARLMDRPLHYMGGERRFFQRGETSSFFGREIGLMYMHAHLRYAETLARMGQADAFFRSLRQATPIDYRSVVPRGSLRQVNCYFSSSDGDFRTRYEADQHYDDLRQGRVGLNGGWRVYSSGPGIFTRLVVQAFLGLRRKFGQVVIDPVMPEACSGLRVDMTVFGKPLSITYEILGSGSVKSVHVNGGPVYFTREENPYREGGAVLSRALWDGLSDNETTSLVVFV
jgi:cellobiose phosphorylase